jgi:signal transduction histidine kinase
VRRRGDALEVVVEDDGVGPADGAVESAAGIGLRTVRDRIESRYDGAGRFTVSGSPGRGFRVALGFPADPDMP